MNLSDVIFIRSHRTRQPAGTTGPKPVIGSDKPSQQGSYSKNDLLFLDGIELGLILIASFSQES